MGNTIKAFAAHEPKGKFVPFEFDAGELGNNEAFKHLEGGKARYRIVLENDF